MAQGAAERLLDGAGEPAVLVGRELVGTGQRMNAGGEKGFVDVNVSQAGDEALIEQGVLDGAGRLGETLAELRGTEFEGLGTHVFFIGVGAEPPDSAKAAGIFESQISAES